MNASTGKRPPLTHPTREPPPNDDVTQAPGSGIFTEEDWQTIARHLDLHGRMLEVVRGIFDDKTEFALAADLHISLNTVHTYWGRVRQKLSVHTRVGLILTVTQAFLRLPRR